MEQLVKDEKGQIIGFNVDPNCQFVKEMTNPKNVILVNEKNMNKAYYNLIVSIRDIRLYIRGYKPNRNWKITPVKEYFGFTLRDNNLFVEYLEGIKDFIDNGTN